MGDKELWGLFWVLLAIVFVAFFIVVNQPGPVTTRYKLCLGNEQIVDKDVCMDIINKGASQ